MSELRFAAWIVAWAIAAFALGTAAVSCRRETPRALTHVEAAPPPAGPPCIHEVCAERPAFLVGVGHYGNGGYTRYRIEYERHCACDRWATLASEQDGGAP